MAKKIDKSKSHCTDLLKQAEKARQAYINMHKLMSEDSSANPNERQADMDWAARQIATATKAITWWEGDITRMEEKAQAAKVPPAVAAAS